jgi:hypothetical protein
MTKTVTNTKPSPNTKPHEINNNTSSENLPKKHQQTVRFTDQKNGKSKLRSSVAVAESDESIISDAKYTPASENSQHVGMMVK